MTLRHQQATQEIQKNSRVCFARQQQPLQGCYLTRYRPPSRRSRLLAASVLPTRPPIQPIRPPGLAPRARLRTSPEPLTTRAGAACAAHWFNANLDTPNMIRSLPIGALVVAFVAPAAAHVTLEHQQAKVSAPYKAVLRVPHGCEGTATTAIRVKIPDGVIGVKPMPKSGWTLTTVTD